MKALAVSEEILLLIRAAVREDVGTGDRTAEAAIPAGLRTEGRVVARRAGVLSGGCLVGAILREYDQDLKFEMCVEEGGAWKRTRRWHGCGGRRGWCCRRSGRC